MITLSAINHVASGPTPNTIGNGPMKITPPTLAVPLPNAEATITKIMPAMTTAKPKNSIVRNLFETLIPSSSFSVSFLFSTVFFSP
jgi:hypothetical protein